MVYGYNVTFTLTEVGNYWSGVLLFESLNNRITIEVQSSSTSLFIQTILQLRMVFSTTSVTIRF